LTLISKKRPLVSVIIPTYNRLHTIDRALKSAINQTYDNLEIIIIDDGSTDGTESFIKNINDERIIYVRHQHNKGESTARTTGVQIANGEYIAYLDSDDEWMPEKTAIQLESLLKHGSNIIAGCTGHFKIHSDQKFEFQPPENAFWFKWFLFQCLLGPGSTLMATRTAFDKVGYYDERLIRFPDWDWLIRYTEFYPFLCISKPLATIYIGNPPSAKEVQASAMVFIQKNKEKFYSLGFWYGRKVMARRFLYIGIHWLREKNYKKGIFYILKGLKYFPFQPPNLFIRKIIELKRLYSSPIKKFTT